MSNIHLTTDHVDNTLLTIKWLLLASVTCLWTSGKPSRYTTNHQGQLSLSSLWGR